MKCFENIKDVNTVKQPEQFLPQKLLIVHSIFIHFLWFYTEFMVWVGDNS